MYFQIDNKIFALLVTFNKAQGYWRKWFTATDTGISLGQFLKLP